jgi:anti-sigma regulatory factor (Ser/Thr protein kinase)
MAVGEAMPACVGFRIRESSQRGEVRRAAEARADALGFGDEDTGRVALVVSELAGNLVKHAPRGGEIFVGALERSGGAAIEVVCVDEGPGIADRQEALRDGYSTAGSTGTGLGAVERLSDDFDLYSPPGYGTIVVSRIWRDRRPERPAVDIGGVCAAMDGEEVTGDAYAMAEADGRLRIVVADGLGHGVDAGRASAEAVRVFRREQQRPVGEVLATMHAALRATRGAAVAVAEIDHEARTLDYAGLGNIAGVIVGRETIRNLVSHNGTVGHSSRRIQQFRYELPADALLVLHSDGLKSRWSLDGYPGLLQRAPGIVAAILYRDFQRGRDDATAVVARVP